MRILLTIAAAALAGACTPSTQSPATDPKPAAMTKAAMPSESASGTDAFSAFIGEFSAARLIAARCDGFTATDRQSAGTIARSERGLGRQRVLHVLYYGNRDSIHELRDQELNARGVDPSDTPGLCRLGRQSAGQGDGIGRFLRVAS